MAASQTGYPYCVAHADNWLKRVAARPRCARAAPHCLAPRRRAELEPSRASPFQVRAASSRADLCHPRSMPNYAEPSRPRVPTCAVLRAAPSRRCPAPIFVQAGPCRAVPSCWALGLCCAVSRRTDLALSRTVLFTFRAAPHQAAPLRYGRAEPNCARAAPTSPAARLTGRPTPSFAPPLLRRPRPKKWSPFQTNSWSLAARGAAVKHSHHTQQIPKNGTRLIWRQRGPRPEIGVPEK